MNQLTQKMLFAASSFLQHKKSNRSILKENVLLYCARTSKQTSLMLNRISKLYLKRSGAKIPVLNWMKSTLNYLNCFNQITQRLLANLNLI